MPEWNIYYEPADKDTERVFLGRIKAETMSEALELAAQYWEYPQHDLVAIQVK